MISVTIKNNPIMPKMMLPSLFKLIRHFLAMTRAAAQNGMASTGWMVTMIAVRMRQKIKVVDDMFLLFILLSVILLGGVVLGKIVVAQSSYNAELFSYRKASGRNKMKGLHLTDLI